MLCAMNPTKMRACECLMRRHEKVGVGGGHTFRHTSAYVVRAVTVEVGT